MHMKIYLGISHVLLLWAYNVLLVFASSVHDMWIARTLKPSLLFAGALFFSAFSIKMCQNANTSIFRRIVKTGLFLVAKLANMETLLNA